MGSGDGPKELTGLKGAKTHEFCGDRFHVRTDYELNLADNTGSDASNYEP